MTFQETCDYLYSQTPSFEKTGKTGFNEGLAVTMALDEYFGHPHRSFKSIHIAGTNGKGSVSHTIAAHLQKTGWRVGLYTSPHLVDFRERIRIDGEMIPEEYVVKFVEENREFFEPLRPSFFELTTALAFKYFAEQHIDIAVIEVGLGGRLDCTNIISPVLSVITNISLDHTDMLGDTLALIAREKAGIIKPHVPVIIGESLPDTRPVFEAIASERQAPIVFADEQPLLMEATPLPCGGMKYVTIDGHDFKGDLSGWYQAKNTNTVLCALHLLFNMGLLKNIDYDAFSDVSRQTGLMGRWYQVGSHPTIICDTGHNIGGWAYLSRQLEQVECRQMHIIFGMVSDKDVEAVVKVLPKKAIYYFTKSSSKRSMPETEMMRLGRQYGLHGQSFTTVREAFYAAKEAALPDEFIFIGGSTYVVAEMMETCL